ERARILPRGDARTAGYDRARASPEDERTLRAEGEVLLSPHAGGVRHVEAGQGGRAAARGPRDGTQLAHRHDALRPDEVGGLIDQPARPRRLDTGRGPSIFSI